MGTIQALALCKNDDFHCVSPLWGARLRASLTKERSSGLMIEITTERDTYIVASCDHLDADGCLFVQKEAQFCFVANMELKSSSSVMTFIRTHEGGNAGSGTSDSTSRPPNSL